MGRTSRLLPNSSNYQESIHKHLCVVFCTDVTPLGKYHVRQLLDCTVKVCLVIQNCQTVFQSGFYLPEINDSFYCSPLVAFDIVSLLNFDQLYSSNILVVFLMTDTEHLFISLFDICILSFR